MRVKQLFTDDSAVSPVIGVILMVAITVILAAVIGSFVLNLGGSLQQSAPQASFDFDFNGNSDVDVTHSTGDTIDEGTVYINSDSGSQEKWAGVVSAGDTKNYDDISADDTVRVIWNSENDENSATLSQSTAPS